MRGELAITVMLLLASAAALGAQRPDSLATKQAPSATEMSADRAALAALGWVRDALQERPLGSCEVTPDPRVVVVSSELHPRGNRSLYVVAVRCLTGHGHLRLLLDPRSGEVLSTLYDRRNWSDAPDWWKQGLDRAPR